MSEFPYTPLTGPDQIRVLRLEPSQDITAPLRGSLRTIKLSSNGSTPAAAAPPVSSEFNAQWQWRHFKETKLERKYVNKNGIRRLVEVQVSSPGFVCPRKPYWNNDYDALSYTWDSQEKPHSIQIGHCAMRIGKNLNSALLKLRDMASARVLWVDSICINQENVRERNHQVHMMKHIYSNAASVVVWLGPDSVASQAAMDMMIDYHMMPANTNILEHNESTLIGLSDIFLRRWWKRIWIVQEVVAARELVIFCGRYIVPWSLVRRVCDMIRRKEFSSEARSRLLRSSGYRNFTALDDFRQARGTMGLAKYLQCTKDYEATDMRDKLYALLGVSCDISPEDIVPDYDKSTRAVFLDLVRFLVTRRRSLDIISSGRLSRLAPTALELKLEGSQGDIPSWLPDWRVSKGLRALNSEGEDGASYRAGSDALAVVKMEEFPFVLQVEGIVVDKVDFFGGAITSPAQESLPTLQRWKYIAGQHLTSKNNFGEVTPPAFWDTIVAGRVSIAGRRRPSPNHNGIIISTSGAKSNSQQELSKSWAKYRDNLQDFVGGSQVTGDFVDTVTRAVMGRRFFITRKKRMGLGVPEIQLNDRVVVVKGCSVPLIMRAVGDHMVIIGESYVSGIMDGEVIRDLGRGQYKSRMIRLR